MSTAPQSVLVYHLFTSNQGFRSASDLAGFASLPLHAKTTPINESAFSYLFLKRVSSEYLWREDKHEPGNTGHVVLVQAS